LRSLPLRTSLTLWFVGLAAAVITLASAALFIGVRTALLAGLDAELRACAEGIGALCEWEDDHVELEGALEESLEVPVLRHASAVEIREWPSLEVVRSFGALLPADVTDVPFAARTLQADELLRVVTVRVPLHRSGAEGSGAEGVLAPEELVHASATAVLVRVGGSLAQLQQSLVWLAGFALVTCLLSLVAAAGFGMFVARRVIRPLQELGDAAAAVHPGSTARLPVRGTADEVDQLAGILGTTFASLQAALERQRRFTSDASHELRTPVAILQTETEIALRRTRTVPEHEALIARVHETAGRMGRMIESLLTLARLHDAATLEAGPVDLAALVEDVLAERGHDGSVEVHTQFDRRAAADIDGDAELLRMVVDNLLSNALRFAASRVDISINGGIGATAGIAGIAGIELRVRDDGPGVEAHELPLLFERFFRGNEQHGHSGAGLGLALVEAIAAAHGGRCHAENTHPGLLVVVTLPSEVEPTSARGLPRPRRAARRRRGPTADEDPSHRPRGS